MPGLPSAQPSAGEPGVFVQAKTELPLSSLQVQQVVNFPGSQAHTHLWRSASTDPLTTWYPSPDRSPSYPLHGFLLSSWSSSVVTTNMQQSHTCPTDTETHRLAGLPPNTSIDPASTWDACWDPSCLLSSRHSLKSACEYTLHTHSFGKMHSHCPAALTRNMDFARCLTHLIHPGPPSSYFFGTHIIPVPVSGV